MLAFEYAVSLGVDALECDVHLSRDGQLVVIHDATVDRTTSQTGAVGSFTAAELEALDAAWSFVDASGRPAYRASGVGIPLLTDVFRRFPDTPLVVEIKGDNPAIVPRVLEAITRHGRERSVVLGGFSRRVLSAVRLQAPAIVTSASRAEVQGAMRRSWFWLSPRNTGCRLFQMPYRFRGRQILTRRLVRAVRRASLPVHAWIVDEPGDIVRLLEWGVTGIITDRPDIACEIVAERA